MSNFLNDARFRFCLLIMFKIKDSIFRVLYSSNNLLSYTTFILINNKISINKYLPIWFFFSFNDYKVCCRVAGNKGELLKKILKNITLQMLGSKCTRT